mgnify:CR=1 FL=1
MFATLCDVPIIQIYIHKNKHWWQRQHVVISDKINVKELINSKIPTIDEIDKVTKKGYKTGFVVMNLKNLSGFSYNADEKIYSASTIKGPYVVSLVKSDNAVFEKEKNGFF